LFLGVGEREKPVKSGAVDSENIDSKKLQNRYCTEKTCCDIIYGDKGKKPESSGCGGTVFALSDGITSCHFCFYQ
jgi:hypothetical protein